MTPFELVPLLDLGPLLPELPEFLAGLALLALMWLIVAKAVAPRFEELYERRSDEIEGGIRHAEQVQAEADAARAEYRKRLDAVQAEGASSAAHTQTAPAPAAPTVPSAAPTPRKKESKAKRAGAADAPSSEGASRNLDMSVWQKFQAALKAQHKLAYSLLSGAAYEGMTKTHFFIRPSSDMARDYIQKRHHSIFEEIMTAIAGRPMSIICTGGAEADVPPAAVPPAPDYPAPVKELLKIAGEGAVVEEITQPARTKKSAAATNAVPEEMPDAPYEPTPEEEAEMMGFDALPDDPHT